MKKILFLFTFLLLFNFLAAQKYSVQDIVGKWKVIGIAKKTDNPNMKDLLKGFESAVFEFKENFDFKLTTTNPTKLFIMVTERTNKSKWKLRKNKFSISIGSDANGYSIMKIIVLEYDNKTIFYLAEPELQLEVQKI